MEHKIHFIRSDLDQKNAFTVRLEGFHPLQIDTEDMIFDVTWDQKNNQGTVAVPNDQPIEGTLPLFVGILINEEFLNIAQDLTRDTTLDLDSIEAIDIGKGAEHFLKDSYTEFVQNAMHRIEAFGACDIGKEVCIDDLDMYFEDEDRQEKYVRAFVEMNGWIQAKQTQQDVSFLCVKYGRNGYFSIVDANGIECSKDVYRTEPITIEEAEDRLVDHIGNMEHHEEIQALFFLDYEPSEELNLNLKYLIRNPEALKVLHGVHPYSYEEER